MNSDKLKTLEQLARTALKSGASIRYRTSDDRHRLLNSAQSYMLLGLAGNEQQRHWLETSEEELYAKVLEAVARFVTVYAEYRDMPTTLRLDALRQEGGDCHNTIEMLIDRLQHELEGKRTD